MPSRDRIRQIMTHEAREGISFNLGWDYRDLVLTIYGRREEYKLRIRGYLVIEEGRLKEKIRDFIAEFKRAE